MRHRYDSDRDPRRGGDRPRDESGRFEPEADRNIYRRRYEPEEPYGSREEVSQRDYDRSEYRGNQQFDNRFERHDYERLNREASPSRTTSESNSQYERMDDRVKRQNFGNANAGSNSDRLGYYRWNDPDARYSEGPGMSAGSNYRFESVYGTAPYSRNSQLGPHTGRGPKGYRRSDDRIEEDVNEALSQHPEIDASEIEVKVSNGEVTLSGSVSERYFKRMAEDIAERCSGVHDVSNQIRVTRQADIGSSQSDQQIKGKLPAQAGGKHTESKTA